MGNNLLKIIVFTSILVLISSSVLAIGIRPAFTSIDSNEVTQLEGSFWVINSNNQNLDLEIKLQGEMSQYVELDIDSLSFREDDDSKEVSFTVSLPDEVFPGNSIATIIVEEELISTGQNVVSSKLILKHKIKIQGEYPDKYVTAKLNFKETEDDFQVISEVENLGQEDIEQVQTTYYVNNQEQITIETLVSNTESLGQGKNKLFTSALSKGLLSQGEFEVVAIVEYDGNIVEVIKTLFYGKPEVEVTYFNEYFTANEINPYVMELLNKWNEKVENVFVDIEVKKEDQNIGEFRTKSIDIKAFAREKIEDYYDASGIDEGEYVFSMVVNFWNTYKMDQQEFEVTLLNKKDQEEMNLVGAAMSKDNSDDTNPSLNDPVSNTDMDSSSLSKVIFIMLTMVMIVGLVLIILLRRKRDDGWEKEQGYY